MSTDREFAGENENWTWRAKVVAEKHYVNGHRTWCPPMCPNQMTPRPSTERARRRLIREWKKDGTYEE